MQSDGLIAASLVDGKRNGLPVNLPRPQGSAEAILREAARLKARDRSAAAPDYTNDPESFVFTRIGGKPALIWKATFTVQGRPYVEYFTRCLSDSMVLMLFVSTPTEELPIIQPEIDALRSTLQMP